MRLANPEITLEFDDHSATLTAIRNHLTGEIYRIGGDQFAVAGDGFHFGFKEFRRVKLEVDQESIHAWYAAGSFTIEVEYHLGTDDHFAEKRLAIATDRNCGLTRVVVSEWSATVDGLKLVEYRQPDFARIYALAPWKPAPRPPGSEPIQTFFGRTTRGGFFSGIEMPFADTRCDGSTVTLAFAPNLKLIAGERFECEPVYFGVSRRGPQDDRAADWRAHDDPSPQPPPLPSESAAMVRMTGKILGPPRHGLTALACGWHCEMEQRTYTPASLDGDLRSLEFIKECGLDGVTDCHPWAGETARMNALREGDRYHLGPLERRFLERARELGLGIVQWPTMNNTHPWRSDLGKPFRADKPEWLRGTNGPATSAQNFRNLPSNCFANRPFFDWLKSIIFAALDTGLYDAWCMDGDFWGSGAYYHTTLPVTCTSDRHDHLPGDANFACQRALDTLIAEVRRRYPKIFIGMCRPPMDLGVWSHRNCDSAFTLIETGSASSNLTAGDEIRTCSRIRVQHHFFPHYLDWPLLFPSYAGHAAGNGDPLKRPAWPVDHFDYILLSALSCSPVLLMYLPTKTGLPDADKQAIRHWLDWGRQNIEYLKVRKDLPDWPRPGRVDGSAHIIIDRGLVFLFNSGPDDLPAEFVLIEESIGLTAGSRFAIYQEHPSAGKSQTADHGATIRWTVPARTAVVLRLEPE